MNHEIEPEIESVVRSLYECLSGLAGAPRDWQRFRGLASPGARFVRVVTDGDGRFRARTFDVEEYIADVSPFLREHDFHEMQVGLRVERFGRIAHAFSRYEARPRPESSVILRRGVNSIQLWRDDARWWVASVVWEVQP